MPKKLDMLEQALEKNFALTLHLGLGKSLFYEPLQNSNIKTLLFQADK